MQRGHFDPDRMTGDYQQICFDLVKSGCVVLSYDPIGQGERRQNWTAKDAEFDSLFSTSLERALIGNLLTLLGESAAGLQVWDGMRTVDNRCGTDLRKGPVPARNVGRYCGAGRLILLFSSDVAANIRPELDEGVGNRLTEKAETDTAESRLRGHLAIRTPRIGNRAGCRRRDEARVIRNLAAVAIVRDHHHAKRVSDAGAHGLSRHAEIARIFAEISADARFQGVIRRVAADTEPVAFRKSFPVRAILRGRILPGQQAGTEDAAQQSHGTRRGIGEPFQPLGGGYRPVRRRGNDVRLLRQCGCGTREEERNC